MKAIRIITLAIVLLGLGINGYCQDGTYDNERRVRPRSEEFGNTLNMGLGMVYYPYVGQTVPALHLNYEIDVARNFTLAPFLTYFGYREYTYTADANFIYRNYYQRTVLPIGLKGNYYFDELLNANNKWDFYLGASLGAAFRKAVYVDGYYGTRAVARSSTGLYLDGHIGTEYHINRSIGLTVDLSTGISTLGIAAHF